MMRFTFIITSLCLWGDCLSLQCYHCTDKDGICRHPQDFYPPISFCSTSTEINDHNVTCAEVRLKLVPDMKAITGMLWMSFGEGDKEATFRGCAPESYCGIQEHKDWNRIGLKVESCRMCNHNLCNSGNNLFPFVKLLLLGAAVPFLFFLLV